MALSMSLVGCLFLACALNFVEAQPLDASVYRQLTAAELRERDLRQNPNLLDLAARTGESVTVIIGAAEQGAIVQESVNTVLDCGPWLSNFPGGTVRWYRYLFIDMNFDNTIPGDRTFQDPDEINDQDPLRMFITGAYDEIYNITRVLIAAVARDSSRGIYECEVCVARGTPFEDCHSANTTVAVAGRPPIIMKGIGRDPTVRDAARPIYDVGSIICLNIDPVDPNRNNPLLRATLRCADVGEVPEENIPSPIPPAVFTWTFRHLDGRTEDYAVNATSTELAMGISYTPPQDFLNTFDPEIGVIPATDAGADATSLDFSTSNITKNFSSENTPYLNLREAYGFWTCTMTNALGSDTATTLITDMCGMDAPSIIRDCTGVGTPIDSFVSLVERGQAVPIQAGCDVCIRQAAELWLTLTCRTNVASFPNSTILSTTWTDEDGDVVGDRPTLLVQDPGSYTCRVDFGNDNIDRATSSIGYVPDVKFNYTRDNSENSGCYRLRTDADFSSNDICAFDGEDINIECISGQEGVTGTPVVDGSMDPRSSFTAGIINDDEIIVCAIGSTNPDVDGRCAIANALNLTVYDPAIISIDRDETCSTSAGQVYGSVSGPGLDGIAILCCLVDGFPEPAAVWTRIVRNSAGIAEEVLVTDIGDPDYVIDDEFNRLIISNYQPGIHDGTYVCRAENIAGIDHATVAITSTVEGTEWRVSPWSECEPNCVGGTRTRSVWCESAPDGIVIADVLCNCDLKPASSELCTDVPGLDDCFLLPLWKTGEYSACSRGCAGGVRYREVYCASLLDGSPVDPNRCIELYGPDGMPPAYDICYNRCCVRDIYPEYCRSTGTGPCGNPLYQQYCCWTCGLTEFP